MGYSSYSTANRMANATANSYYTTPVEQILKARTLQSAMSPMRLGIRESRDSEAHPNSVAIIFALDVTGSMLSVPQEMIRDGLPTLMSGIIQAGTPDPQLLFLGIGDHECDRAPLQVGQFESGDEELDKWLTQIYLEKGGGANDGESYLLAWYVAAFHTSIDCLEKRNEKGFLFTVGDEPVLNRLPASYLRTIFGEGQYKDWTAAELLEEAKKKYEVYHIHTRETGTGRRWGAENKWKALLGQNLLVIENHVEIPGIVARTVLSKVGSTTTPLVYPVTPEDSVEEVL